MQIGSSSQLVPGLGAIGRPAGNAPISAQPAPIAPAPLQQSNAAVAKPAQQAPQNVAGGSLVNGPNPPGGVGTAATGTPAPKTPVNASKNSKAPQKRKAAVSLPDEEHKLQIDLMKESMAKRRRDEAFHNMVCKGLCDHQVAATKMEFDNASAWLKALSSVGSGS